MERDKEIITQSFFAGINISNIELFGVIKHNYDSCKPILPIIEFVIERLVTVTQLACNGSNWDAEIIYRSALETLIKLVFITSADGVERDIRIREYWEDLAEINSLKQSEQAKKNLNLFKNEDSHRLIYAPMLLNPEKEAQLREKWPKKVRQKIEQKWSFSEMIASLTKSYIKGESAPFFEALSHQYRNSSHITHGDETGILIIKERSQRADEERAIADFAHFAKHLSESFHWTIFMAMHVSRFVDEDANFFRELSKTTKEADDLVGKYLNKLGEDPIYNPFRK